MRIPFHVPSLLILASLGAGRVGAQKVQVCLIPTAVETSGSSNAAVDAVRATFASYLSGPSVTTQSIQARLASQAREEATQAGCPFVLLTTLKHVVKRGGGGLLGQVAAGAVRQGAFEAGMASGSTAGRIAGSAVAGGMSQAAFNYAVNVRNKDEIALGWQLESGDGKVLAEGKDKRTAKADGEDLLSPLIEQASDKVLEAAKRGLK